MRIGVVSDTHGYFDPRLRETFSGVDVILHGGDVDTQEVLHELEQIAPVHAVRGNVDGPELGLPFTRILPFEGAQIHLQHILSAQQAEVEMWAADEARGKAPSQRCSDFLKGFDRQSHVILFGHSHQPCLIALSGVLFFNPGSAGKRRFSLPRCCGLLELSSTEIKGTLIGLEEKGKPLPAEVVMNRQTR